MYFALVRHNFNAMQEKSVDFSKSDVKMGKNDIFRTIIFLHSKHATYFDRLLRIIISAKRTFYLYGIITQLKSVRTYLISPPRCRVVRKYLRSRLKYFLCPYAVIINKESRQGVCPAGFLLYRSYVGDRFQIHALFRGQHYFSAFAAGSVNFCKSNAILGENDIFREFNLPRSQSSIQAVTVKQ